MRLVSVCCMLLLLCGLAVGQASTMGGTASNWLPSYGPYVGPYVPLITTPEVSLSTVSPWSAGASSSAFGLMAGATNSTLSREFVAAPPAPVFSQPVWYGQTEAELGVPGMRPHPPHEMHVSRREKEQGFDFISQGREYRESAATLLAGRGPVRKAARSYTNQDIDRQNQNNGLVKYDGKTEHI